MSNKQPSQEILNKILSQFNQNNLGEAEKMANLLLKEHSNNVFSLKILAIIYDKQGKHDKALEYNKKVVSINSRDPNAYNNLGISYKNSNLIHEAVTSFKQATKLNPFYSDAYYNLSNALDLLGERSQSYEANLKAVNYGSENKQAYIKLRKTLSSQGRDDEAVVYLEHALTLNPRDVELRLHYGNCLGKLGRYEQALKCFNEILDDDPENPDAHLNRGFLFMHEGQHHDALVAFKKAVSLNSVEASFHLAEMKQYTLDDSHLSLMQSLYKSNHITEHDRCLLCFALAKAYEDIGDTEKQFSFLQEGNAIKDDHLKYDEAKDIDYNKRIISNLQNLSKHSLKFEDVEINTIPIFIVGMPRSGTTLVEQILSSHENIKGCGELWYIKQFGGEISLGLTQPTKENLMNFRYRYFEKINNISDGSKMIVDKMPANFNYLGAIVSAFPEAKIINVRRCPEATCWGIYKKSFGNDTVSYSYNLEHIKSYFIRYAELMKSYSNYFHDKIYELKYETLVENQEIETKNLLKHLGVKWDNECLFPEKNQRIVRTASTLQVRKKVYQGSSAKWEKYKPFLGGVFDDLKEYN